MKKSIIYFLICTLITIGIILFKQQQTIECWWGVCYPQLSFIGFEDTDENENNKLSSTDLNHKTFIKTTDNNEKIKFKFFIFDWFDKYYFRKEK